MNIAILGATSHIAKGLVARFLGRGSDHLTLFVRAREPLLGFLAAIGRRGSANQTIRVGYDDFAAGTYDAIVNCVGVETRNKHNCDFTRYFSVTERFDNLAINYLAERNRDAIYVSFSSGAVYGKGFAEPVGDASVNALSVNRVVPEDYYGIVRLHAEAKHRAHGALNIVDLRIFNYFSRHINLTDGYFITDVLEAILHNAVLVTDDTDMVRDYVHPDDLFELVNACVAARTLNTAIDVRSARPVAKQDILDYFSGAYGLRYETRHRDESASATGAKRNYFSGRSQIAEVSFAPRFASMDSLKQEARYILEPGQRKLPTRVTDEPSTDAE